MKPQALKFKAVVLRENHGYSSLCLDLDVASQGNTRAQAKRMLREAVVLYLETAIGSNLPYLRPIPPSENPLLTSPANVLETFDLKISVRLVADAA